VLPDGIRVGEVFETARAAVCLLLALVEGLDVSSVGRVSKLRRKTKGVSRWRSTHFRLVMSG
jgi:hypothetical protein